MDKIKFGQLISYITMLVNNNHSVLSPHHLEEIEIITTPITQPALQHPIVSAVDVETLIKCMQEKTHKIDAIKAARQITDLGLKDAKDLVERYWT